MIKVTKKYKHSECCGSQDFETEYSLTLEGYLILLVVLGAAISYFIK